MNKLERSIEQSFTRACRKYNLWQRKDGLEGMPDRKVILHGPRIVWIEFKAPGETPRPGQWVKIHKLRRRGFEVHVIDNAKEAKELAYRLSKEDCKAANGADG